MALWGVLWRSIEEDGVCEYLIYENLLPPLFNTRAQARKWINERYGYIKTRKDLRNYPYCWRMPQPVKVKVVISEDGQSTCLEC